ncbi:hypothetical protein BTO30_00570 [Domibacillus antri]|uniref:Uncharacterized protein n=1 Tax=Domibacillus antri TaxID=1714264 RepID=A0A1Q8Q9C5_9BACI|nr:hypothetical protein [Domibacillus antri]OLN23956.1 hypothetical protein BTO30_00570 [Domibacillus antri]
MTNARVDTVENYFNKVSTISKVSNTLFWCSVILSFTIFFSGEYLNFNNLLNVLFILITVLYFIFSNWLSLFLLREAQNRRRVHLLSNSLGSKLDDEETNLYYNNPQSPSLYRLGMNVFENSLFTFRVTEKMVIGERIRIIVYLIVWMALMLFRETDLNLVSIVAQTIFTTGILISWIKLEILRHTSEKIFNEFRQLFLTNGSEKNDKIIPIILNLVFRYETTVASMGVHFSSKIFHSINPNVSTEWETVKRNIGL